MKSIADIAVVVMVSLLLAACDAAVPDGSSTVIQPADAIQPAPHPTATAATVKETATKTGDNSALQAPQTGPTAAQLRLLNSLPNQGPAPELLNDRFLNSEPLRLADLRGQVVIVEFWTFG